MAHDRVLIITYIFPPSGGVGVPRFVAYTRYLPLHNCEPFVLTARNPATPAYDLDLAKKVPPETKVFRAFNPEIPYAVRDRFWKKIIAKEPAAYAEGAGAAKGTGLKSLARRAIQRIFCPDVQVIWVPFAIRAARRIIAKHRITTVILNLPPYSCLNIGVAVKRHFPNVKLILDFRDEWIDNYFDQFDSAASDYKLRLAQRLERSAVECADLVTAVTRSQLGQIRKRYPQQPDSKFIYAPNGFDPGLYANFKPRRAPDGKVIVTYFGTVYANPTYRPIVNYLDVADQLPDHLRSRLETRFIGRVAREAASFFDSRRHTIRQFGFMSKEAAMPYLEETGYNLIVTANPTTHGGKLFDYLGAGKPILALGPVEGELGQVVRETRMGWCVNPDDLPAIRALLLSAFERLDSGDTEWSPDWEAISQYQWPNLVARFVKLTGLGQPEPQQSEPHQSDPRP
jgi:hypothetical protein